MARLVPSPRRSAYDAYDRSRTCVSALCIWTTTAAPSPTAAARRLVEPARTSPMANTPGRLVSSGNTDRDFARELTEELTPVITNPLASTSTQPLSQEVFGSAPIKRNKWRREHVWLSPLDRLRKVAPVR